MYLNIFNYLKIEGEYPEMVELNMQWVLYLMDVNLFCPWNSSVKSVMSFKAFAVERYLTKHNVNVSHLN